MIAAPISTDTLLLEKATGFLQSIGISVHFMPLDDNCFLPGISIINGEIVVDLQRLKYPGDILHEAGHIAIVPPAERQLLSAKSIAAREQREAEEMMAIAWSYAACVHLDIDASFVFHNHGYKNGGSSIAENFKQGQYFGVPMLQWIGIAFEKPDASEPGRAVYPAMHKWMRD
ncbi:MAG: hypothetical protein IPH18_11910 [Chitinophagaceae bacterium]|nr:hypothetical protein [Chitinophagaceae bacterium]MBK8952685.1 hypothetical protein [Chitinophagaceae bacterium]